jgi:alpha-D-ribose 1-methylphosphonate 5-triphosphate synthase subunit PhnI
MYVAVKGGERAIRNAEKLLHTLRRGKGDCPNLLVAQIEQQLPLAVDRVMCEGGLYDHQLAALAIKQAAGDLVEAVFLLRAYRTTLPRFGYTEPPDLERMEVWRRISACFKDIPGGQTLGPTFDYTHRLLDFSLLADAEAPELPEAEADPDPKPGVVSLLDGEGIIATEDPTDDREVADLTRSPAAFPAPRDARLQALARADEGFLLGIAYSTQRGYGGTHPFAAEVRLGSVEIEFKPEDLDFVIAIGEITMTEIQMINQFRGNSERDPQFTRGYGLTFGHNERKAMSMALIDRALRCAEYGEPADSPAQNDEFVLSHCDNVEAQGFVQHLKLPHYVDFQAELNMIRRMRTEIEARRGADPVNDAADADPVMESSP